MDAIERLGVSNDASENCDEVDPFVLRVDEGAVFSSKKPTKKKRGLTYVHCQTTSFFTLHT
jgi:hypothetical protein